MPIKDGKQTFIPHCMRFLYFQNWWFFTFPKKTLLGTYIPNFRANGIVEHFQKNLEMEKNSFVGNLYFMFL